MPLIRLSLLSIWPLTFSFPIVPPPPPGGPPDEAESKLDSLCSSCDDFEFFSLDTENIPIKVKKIIVVLIWTIEFQSIKYSS